MIGDFQTRIRIPPCFHKQLCGQVPVKSVLRSWGGRRWSVKIGWEDKHLFFGEGWECFVADLTIQLGEFLLFVYDGNLGFDVKIYGVTGCEKKDNIAGIKVEEAEERAPEREMTEKMVAKASNEHKRHPAGEVLNGRVIVRGLKLSGNERALRSARSFKSNRPVFIASYRNYRQDYMILPVSFMRECDLKETETIILKDPKGRSWTVRIAHWVGRTAITKGWRNFGAVNDLTEGDVCVFEFLEADKGIHVHIFRAKENAASILYKAGKCSKREKDVLTAERSIKRDAKFASIILKSKKYVLNIPAHIMKDNAANSVNKTKLCDPSGRLWPVRIRRQGDERIALAQGWNRFCEANNIQVGDVCTFALAGGIQAMDVKIRRSGLRAG